MDSNERRRLVIHCLLAEKEKTALLQFVPWLLRIGAIVGTFLKKLLGYGAVTTASAAAMSAAFSGIHNAPYAASWFTGNQPLLPEEQQYYNRISGSPKHKAETAIRQHALSLGLSGESLNVLPRLSPKDRQVIYNTAAEKANMMRQITGQQPTDASSGDDNWFSWLWDDSDNEQNQQPELK